MLLGFLGICCPTPSEVSSAGLFQYKDTWPEQVVPASVLALYLTVCGDGGFNMCALIRQRTSGVQPHPTPPSTGPGEAALASHQPHTLHNVFWQYPIHIQLPKMYVNVC